jgi:phage-related protein
MVGKALNDPANSLKLLRKLGISFTEGQKAQIASMQIAGNVAGAQGIILDQLAGSFGGAAQNMASPLKQLTNSVEEIAESLGAILGPSVKMIAGALGTMLGPLEESRGSMQALGKMIASFVGAVFAPFAQGAGQVAQLLMGMFAGGSVTAADFGNVAMLSFDNVTLGIMKLIPSSKSTFELVGAYGGAAWNSIETLFWACWENLKTGFIALVDVGKAAGAAIGAAFSAALNLENPITAATDALKEGACEPHRRPEGPWRESVDCLAGHHFAVSPGCEERPTGAR